MGKNQPDEVPVGVKCSFTLTYEMWQRIQTIARETDRSDGYVIRRLVGSALGLPPTEWHPIRRPPRRNT